MYMSMTFHFVFFFFFYHLLYNTQDPTLPPLSMAAAAALALQNVTAMDAPLVVSPTNAGNATTSPKNTINTSNTSATNNTTNTTTGTNNNNTNTILPVQTDEYEQKYRTLLIEAQKLEVTKATAERRMKEESKQHHKQLLRMSAHVTTLQNKLQASNNSANLMLQKIPHVVFTPMIQRDYNVYNTSSGGMYGGNVNSMYGVEYGSVVYEDSVYKPTKGTTSRSRSPNTNPNTIHNTGFNSTPDVTSVSALNSLFDQSLGDISVLLNNSRVPSRGRSAHTANTNTTIGNTSDVNNDDYASGQVYGSDGTGGGNSGNGNIGGRMGTSPLRSRGKSAPAQVCTLLYSSVLSCVSCNVGLTQYVSANNLTSQIFISTLHTGPAPTSPHINPLRSACFNNTLLHTLYSIRPYRCLQQ